MRKIPKQLTEQQQKAINIFLSWWVQMWYSIFLISFFFSWWLVYYLIKKMLYADEMAVFFGFLGAAGIFGLIKKLVYDVLTIKKLDKLIK